MLREIFRQPRDCAEEAGLLRQPQIFEQEAEIRRLRLRCRGSQSSGYITARPKPEGDGLPVCTGSG